MNDHYRFNPSTGEFEKKKGSGNSGKPYAANDKGIGLWGLPFLIFPYIGVVVYFFLKHSKPHKAKSILYWSIAGGIIMFIGMLND